MMIKVALDDLKLPQIFRRICSGGSHPFWLDSGPNGVLESESTWAMGVSPVRVIEGTGDSGGDPFALLGELRKALPKGDGFPRGTTIPLAIFSVAYEAGECAIPMRTPSMDPLGVPRFWGAVYPAVIVGKCGQSEAFIFGDSEEACKGLEASVLSSGPVTPSGKFVVEGDLVPDRSLVDYQRGVERVLEYIAAGDIYQANIARRFEGHVLPGGDPITLFERLRETSSAPFGAYLDLGELHVLSASPECLVRWNGEGFVTSHPIKGTARRHDDTHRDEEAARTLREDSKERAEHMMIVDLIRNDLGRVSKFGSVRVSDCMAIQSFPNVHHLVSCVEGQVQEVHDETDMWRAVFPGGSITGAPKIRACEIIAEIEQAQRGIYCGAIGFLDPLGGGCANIPIRTGVVSGDRVVFHVGGGIVADSSPEREAMETEEKALGWLKALGLGGAS